MQRWTFSPPCSDLVLNITSLRARLSACREGSWTVTSCFTSPQSTRTGATGLAWRWQRVPSTRPRSSIRSFLHGGWQSGMKEKRTGRSSVNEGGDWKRLRSQSAGSGAASRATPMRGRRMRSSGKRRAWSCGRQGKPSRFAWMRTFWNACDYKRLPNANQCLVANLYGHKSDRQKTGLNASHGRGLELHCGAVARDPESGALYTCAQDTSGSGT